MVLSDIIKLSVVVFEYTAYKSMLDVGVYGNGIISGLVVVLSIGEVAQP